MNLKNQMPPSKDHTHKFCLVCELEIENNESKKHGMHIECYAVKLERENKRLREALEKIESNGTNTFVDEKTNLWECTLDSSAQIAKEALESPLDKQGNGEKL